MSAREVIARACTPTPDECFHGSGSIAPGASEFHCLVKMWEREIPRADAIISDLRAAGYAILSPDEVSQIAELKAELDLLQDILDSRPAINAALPDSYIRWSQAIYSGEAIRSLKGGRDAN